MTDFAPGGAAPPPRPCLPLPRAPPQPSALSTLQGLDKNILTSHAQPCAFLVWLSSSFLRCPGRVATTVP